MSTDSAPALFSASYAEARSAFLASAALRQLPVTSHLHPLRGPEGETLAMDVVRDGPADAEQVLLLTAGVHGIEGYAGSAVMRGLLQAPPRLRVPGAQDIALLHVHAVNPHGFAHGRRVNEDNVDLNRNFIDFSQALPANPAYAEIHDLLLPATWPPGEETARALADKAEAWGARGYQAAVSAGQYDFPDGLFYGGQQPTWSHLRFVETLRGELVQARHVAWIDIHTGLGPFGLGERIFATTPSVPEDEARARRWWGQQLTSVHTGTSQSIPLSGPIQFALAPALPGVRMTAICLEYGTYPPAQMHDALRADHRLHRHGGTPAEQARARADLRAFFYPDSDDWKRRVWQQAEEAVCQALAGLVMEP